MSDSPFRHDNRNNIVDMLRPPSGFRVGSAIGTTYSLDFMTLTSVMLAFLDSELEENEEYNVPQQLFALTRLSKKLCLIVNRSGILFSGVKRSNRIFAIYDRMIREIRLPKGSFHPKVWLLRYDPKGTPDNFGVKSVYRLVVSSRNITASSSWEMGVQLSSSPNRKRNAFSQSVAKYFDQINSELSEPHELIEEAASVLPSIEFEFPESVQDCSFAYQWPGENQLLDSLPKSGDRATIVSPFLGKSFLKQMVARFQDVTLISRRRELDEILDQELFNELHPQIFYVNEEMTSEVSTRMTLHAKLLLMESKGQNLISLGSANASRNAWMGNNCEVNVGFRSEVTDQQFMDQFVFKDRKKMELNPWIERYTTQDWENREEPSDDDRIEGQLQTIQASLASFEFELNYEQKSSRLTLRSHNKGQQKEICEQLAIEYSTAAVPLSLIDAGVEPQWEALSIKQAFQKPHMSFDISMAQLTEFVCFRISHTSGLSKSFILKATKHNFGDLLETRDKRLMRAELSAKQFVQFLASVLFDNMPNAGASVSGMLKGSVNKGANQSEQSSVFLEEVLRSCTEDETRIEEVSKIVETFYGQDGEGNRYMSEDFRQFWNEFKLAFEKSVG